jgi:hypothetical protein
VVLTIFLAPQHAVGVLACACCCSMLMRPLVMFAALVLAGVSFGNCAARAASGTGASLPPIRATGTLGPERAHAGVPLGGGGAAAQDVAAAATGWRQLFDGESLAGWAETQFGGEGLVRVRDGAIVLEFGEPMTGITYTGEVPVIDYEVRLEARRITGSDFFCGLTFPVGDSHASLILGGWGGSLVGLSNLEGYDASSNETTQYIHFKDGQWYRVRVRVTADHIGAWLDDSQIIDVTIGGRKLGVRPEMLLSRPLGVAAYRTRAAIRQIELRALEP